MKYPYLYHCVVYNDEAVYYSNWRLLRFAHFVRNDTGQRGLLREGSPRNDILRSGTLPNGDHLDIGHLFHRELDTLASQTALAVAAIRHMIGAEVGRVIDDHATEVQAFDRF